MKKEEDHNPGSNLDLDPGPRGVDSAYERGGDARRKFWIKSLKEINLGVTAPFFDP